MKQLFKKLKSEPIMFVVTLLLALFGVTGVDSVLASAPAAATASAQPTSEHGDAVLGGDGALGEGFQSLAEALTQSPNLVTRKIHEEIIMIAPSDYPARTLMGKNVKFKTKKTKDHKVAVYSTRSKEIKLKLGTAIKDAETEKVALNFGTGNKLVSVTQTITFPDIDGYEKDGATTSGHPLRCYVVGKNDSGLPIVVALNGVALSGGGYTLPDIAVNSRALRGLRIGTETQIRTDPVNILPTDKEYFIQKNIIEFGSTGWFDNASKEVKWGNRERYKAAMLEKLRTSMVDFWLGEKTTKYIKTEYNEGEELAFFSEGLWTQAGKEFDFQGEDITPETLVDFSNYIFKGNNGSSTRICYMGSEVSAAMQKAIVAEDTKFVGEVYRDKNLSLEFTSISFFGGKKILFIDEPSLDDLGMEDCAFVVDEKSAWEENYGMKTIDLDGIKQGKSDTTGQTIVEENCFILANPDAHCRVVLGEKDAVVVP